MIPVIRATPRIIIWHRLVEQGANDNMGYALANEVSEGYGGFV